MGPERKLDVPVYDLSLVRGIWEVRVKKYRQRQKTEEERVEQSALARSTRILLSYRRDIIRLFRVAQMFS